ncbi:hypothetical protein PFISCL1PPCAC_15494, partial [Pristionchus fissidentatus]
KHNNNLELIEALLCSGSLGNLEDVEVDGLCKSPALTSGNNVTELDVPESGRAVNRHVLVSPLITTILLHKVQIISSDDDCPIHLHLDDDTGKKTSTDGNTTGKGALLVDVGSVYSLKRSLEPKSNIANVAERLARLLANSE